MNKKILAVLFIFSAFSFSAAQTKGLGLGVNIGSPSGINGKYWLDKTKAIDFGVGYSLIGADAISIHADYLYHKFQILKDTDELFPFYYGFGIRIQSVRNEKNTLGVRGVIGIQWISKDLPIDVFLEAAPVFKLLPETNLDVDLGLGARYYFSK